MNSINNYPVGNVSPNFCAGKVKSKKVKFPGKGKPVLDNSKLNTSLVRPIFERLPDGTIGEWRGTALSGGQRVEFYKSNDGDPILFMKTFSLYK